MGPCFIVPKGSDLRLVMNQQCRVCVTCPENFDKLVCQSCQTIMVGEQDILECAFCKTDVRHLYQDLDEDTAFRSWWHGYCSDYRYDFDYEYEHQIVIEIDGWTLMFDHE